MAELAARLEAEMRREWALSALLTVGAATACVIAPAAIVYGKALYLGAFVGVCVAILLAVWNQGVATGGLLLLILNGVPFINTRLGTTGAAGSNALNDGVYLALVGLLAIVSLQQARHRELDRVAGFALAWAATFLAWWLIKAVVGSPGVPIYQAAKYGRSFLYFGTLLPLLMCALRTRRNTIGLIAALAAGAALFSLGQIILQLGHAELHWLIHVEHVTEFDGVARVYASMSALIIAAFPLSFAAALLGPKTWRKPALCLAVLTGAANLLSFTRAIYVSELLAMTTISLVWVFGSDWQARRIRGLVLAAMIAVFGIVLSGAAAEGSGEASGSPLSAILSRVALGISNVQNQTGTAGYRLHVEHIELQILGSHWLTGLGFLDPAYHYFPDLPLGSIQNTDLGSLSLLATMGLVGIILAYAVPFAALVYLLRRRYNWVQYGAAMYVTAAVAGSITLGALSTVPGMLVLACVVALSVNSTAVGELTPR